MNLRVLCPTILVAIVITGCVETDRQTSARKPVNDRVQECKAERVLEPRTCEVICTDGLTELICSGDLGAAIISNSRYVPKCEWTSSWNKGLWVRIPTNGIVERAPIISDNITASYSNYGEHHIHFGYRCEAHRFNLQTIRGGNQTGDCRQFLHWLDSGCNGKRGRYKY